MNGIRSRPRPRLISGREANVGSSAPGNGDGALGSSTGHERQHVAAAAAQPDGCGPGPMSDARLDLLEQHADRRLLGEPILFGQRPVAPEKPSSPNAAPLNQPLWAASAGKDDGYVIGDAPLISATVAGRPTPRTERRSRSGTVVSRRATRSGAAEHAASDPLDLSTPPRLQQARRPPRGLACSTRCNQVFGSGNRD